MNKLLGKKKELHKSIQWKLSYKGVTLSGGVTFDSG